MFKVYKTYIEPLHCVNFSIYNDEIQHILWRIENGELDGFSPKVVVVMIGTHNTSHSAEEVVKGISHIIDKIKEKQPQASIILMVSFLRIYLVSTSGLRSGFATCKRFCSYN